MGTSSLDAYGPIIEPEIAHGFDWQKHNIECVEALTDDPLIAIKLAIKQLGIAKKVSAHTFRHSFATHLLQKGTNIRTIQSLLGHNDLETTMIYTHVLNQGGQGVISPLDDL